MSHISIYKTKITQVDSDLLRRVVEQLALEKGATLERDKNYVGRPCAFLLTPADSRSNYYDKVGVCITQKGALELLYDRDTAYASPASKELTMELQRQYIAQAVLKAARKKGLVCDRARQQNNRIQMSLRRRVHA